VIRLLGLGLALVGVAAGASTATWKPLPRAPIAGRIAAGTVWTGKEVLVVGGVSGTEKTDVSDGAAYNPATRTWRKLPAGSGVTGDVEAAAWTGHTAVFWAGNSPMGPVRGAVYDPSTNRWRRLPSGPLGPREGYWSAWTGKELLIVGGTSGDGFAGPVAAAVDPETGSWRVLKGLNTLVGLLQYGTFWTGSRVIIVGKRCVTPDRGSTCTKYRPVFVSYDPATDTRRQLGTTSPPDADRGLISIGWYRHEALFLYAPTQRILGYDPATGRWHAGAAAPCTLSWSHTYWQTAWLGDRYVAACGKTSLQVYDPARDRWTIVLAGPSPLNSRSWSAIAWTGRELFAWSGTIYASGNPTPANGASIVLR